MSLTLRLYKGFTIPCTILGGYKGYKTSQTLQDFQDFSIHEQVLIKTTGLCIGSIAGFAYGLLSPITVPITIITIYNHLKGKGKGKGARRSFKT